MFDPSPPGPQPDDDILPKAAHTLGNMLAAAAGICHGICKVSGTRLPRPEMHHFLAFAIAAHDGTVPGQACSTGSGIARRSLAKCMRCRNLKNLSSPSSCVQLEAEHTVSLHLRSRRVGSDEAVYSIIDLFSTLLARLGNRSEQIFEHASPGRKARHAGIQQTLDSAINVLTSSPMAHLVNPSAIFDCTCEAWCPVNMPGPCFDLEGPC